MNQQHLEFCTSTAWKQILDELILPGAVDGVNLGPNIVEIGPGPGFTTEMLLRTAAHVTAVEIDPALALALRDRLAAEDLDVVVRDGQKTGLETDSHSGGASFHMLHHVATADEQDRIFAELARVVYPGGVIVMADSSPGEDLRAFHERDTFNPIDPAALPRRLTSAGLVDVSVRLHDLGWYCSATVPKAA